MNAARVASPGRIKQFDREFKAASLIQRFVRRQIAKKKATDLFWTHAWNELDIADEFESVHTEEDVDKLLQILQKRKAELQAKKGIAAPAADDHEKFKTPPGYRGPHFQGPVRESQIVDLISLYKEGKQLPYSSAYYIITETSKLCAQSDNICSVYVPIAGRLTVCGDIHGQLADLLFIFTHNGLPSRTNYYVFNGDFVDRGPHGVEVLLLLYAMKLCYPDCFFLNRGNHEMRKINARYGFEEEVRRKYDMELFERIADSYQTLPLCTLIEKKIFVTHGGLFSADGVTLVDINSINRMHDLPAGKRVGPDKMMEELLWSDPCKHTGRAPNHRGSGVQFGADVTSAFLEKNNLTLVIRSHEVKEEGYQYMHHKRLITVFSASNYCGTNRNMGAYIVFNYDADLKPEFHSYHADPLPIDLVDTTMEQRCQDQTLMRLREKIFLQRHQLLFCFTQFDTKKDGRISPVDWSNGLNSVFNLSIPWLRLLPFFAKLEADGRIHYGNFLDRYQLRLSEAFLKLQDDMVAKICEKICKHSVDLAHEFKMMDQDGNGTLSYVEFVEALKKYNLGLTNDQLFDLMRSLDADRSQSIDWNEFVGTFQTTFNQMRLSKEAEYAQWLPGALKELKTLLSSRGQGVRELFDEFDTDGSGEVSYKEFSKFLKRLGIRYSKDQRYRLAKYVDVSGTQSISFKDFSTAFPISKGANNDWQTQIIQRICMILCQNRVQLAVAFRWMDIDNSGKIDLDEFAVSLQSLNILKEYPLTESQIRQLFACIDKDNSGFVEYDEFISSFQVVDTQEAPGRRR